MPKRPERRSLKDQATDAAAAIAELVGILPYYGPPLAALLELFAARATRVREQQLLAWLAALQQAVERLGAEKLNRAWLGSEDGLRVLLALGEASLDLLRQDKIRFLAGAAAASSASDTAWQSSESRFARLIIDADYDVLISMWALACDFGTSASWNLDVATYAADLPQWPSSRELPGVLLQRVDQYSIRDALNSLATYRLLDLVSEGSRGTGLPVLISAHPRGPWPAFSDYLRLAFVLSDEESAGGRPRCE